MLENVNAFFEDRNNDGMPDGFDGLITNAVISTKITADGREYNSIDELPPEVRAKLSRAMGKLDANQNGMPDFLEGMSNAPIQRTNVVSTFETDTPRRVSRTPVVAPTIEPESSSGWMIALAGVFLLMLCAAGAAGVWYFLFR